jgi:hypothetical protein
MGQETVLKGSATANGNSITGEHESPMNTSKCIGHRAA